MLRQIVGDLQPWCLAANKDVALRPNAGVVIEDTQWNPEVRTAPRGQCVVRSRPVDDRRPAPASEAAVEAGRRFVVADEFFTLQKSEIFRAHAGPAAKRGAVLLAAFRTLAIQQVG